MIRITAGVALTGIRRSARLIIKKKKKNNVGEGGRDGGLRAGPAREGLSRQGRARGDGRRVPRHLFAPAPLRRSLPLRRRASPALNGQSDVGAHDGRRHARAASAGGGRGGLRGGDGLGLTSRRCWRGWAGAWRGESSASRRSHRRGGAAARPARSREAVALGVGDGLTARTHATASASPRILVKQAPSRTFPDTLVEAASPRADASSAP